MTHTGVPTVSVLIGVYNPDPEHFRLAIESVLRQSYEDFELLVVEDPSERPAAAVLKMFSDPRIRHHVMEKKGTLVESLNWGLAQARGEFVVRFDADDLCEPDRFSKQIQYLREHPEVGVVGSQLCVIDETGKVTGYRNYPLAHEDIFAAMPFYDPIAQPSVVFRKDVVVSRGGYRQYYTEDYELWSRLATEGVRFANHPEVLISYRIVREGIRPAKVRRTIEGTLEVKRLYWTRRMSLGARCRMWVERCLCWVPPRLVLSLFMWLVYRRTLPKGMARPVSSPTHNG